MPANAAVGGIVGGRAAPRHRACSGPRSRSAPCRPRAALNISSRLTLVERSRLRDGLPRVRDAGEDERREAVSALVRAVHDGVGFPSPARHDEAKCPFRRIEATAAEEVAAVLASCARTQPLLVATALCHLGPTYRAEVVEPARSTRSASAVRPTLQPDPGNVGDPDRDVRARSTRPDRASPLTRYEPGVTGMCTPMRPPGFDVDQLADRRAGRRARGAAPPRTPTPRRTRESPTSTAGIASAYCTYPRIPCATIAAIANDAAVSTARGARERTSTTVVTSVSTTSISTERAVNAGEVGDRDAQPLRVAVTAVRPGRGHERARDHDADRPHVHDAHEQQRATG